MILPILLLSFASTAAEDPRPATPSLLAIRVGRAETIAKGTLEHAVILIEGGKIVTIGEDLPIARGIPVLDRPDWVVMPGLVNAYSRLGLDSDGGDEFSPEIKASRELYPDSEDLREVVEYGVTTLGLYPAGNGIPGQSVAIRPLGKTREELILEDPSYLKIIVRATSGSKKALQDGFKKADEYADKEKKAREKWDKEQEKKKAKPAAKKEEPKPEEKKGEEKKEEPKPDEAKPEEKKDAAAADAYVPPEPEPKVKPFVDLRAQKLRALVSVQSAGEYLHFLDAIGKEKFLWDLRLPLQRESDLFYVLDKKTFDLEVDGIGDKKVRCVVEPVLTLHPGTMRTRNLPMELAQAGAKLVFVPRSDSLADHKAWLAHVSEVVNSGLDRDVALRALTLEPATLLRVEARLGSLEKNKDANMVFFDGDPFEPRARIQAVMLDGRFVFGEVKL